jgi:hypothetical protein
VAPREGRSFASIQINAHYLLRMGAEQARVR